MRDGASCATVGPVRVGVGDTSRCCGDLHIAKLTISFPIGAMRSGRERTQEGQRVLMAAMMRPRRRLPLSPRKIRAGLKL